MQEKEIWGQDEPRTTPSPWPSSCEQAWLSATEKHSMPRFGGSTRDGTRRFSFSTMFWLSLDNRYIICLYIYIYRCRLHGLGNLLLSASQETLEKWTLPIARSCLAGRLLALRPMSPSPKESTHPQQNREQIWSLMRWTVPGSMKNHDQNPPEIDTTVRLREDGNHSKRLHCKCKAWSIHAKNEKVAEKKCVFLFGAKSPTCFFLYNPDLIHIKFSETQMFIASSIRILVIYSWIILLSLPHHPKWYLSHFDRTSFFE